MQKTKNYGLNKPDEKDFYDVNDFNSNMDAIDAELKKHDDGIAMNESRIDNLVVNAGDSSAECADARVDANAKSHDNLKQRLDSEYNQLSSEIGTLSSEIVDVESEFDNLFGGYVVSDKTNFYPEKALDASGNLSYSNLYHSSVYVPVSKGDIVEISDYRIICWFDTNKTVISSDNVESTSVKRLSAPQNGFVMASFRTTNLSTFYIKTWNDKRIPTDKVVGQYLGAENIKGYIEIDNLLNNANNVVGHAIDSISFKDTENEKYTRTEFIEVEGEQYYTFFNYEDSTKGARNVIFFDKDKNGISQIGGDGFVLTRFITPSNCKYVVLNLYNERQHITTYNHFYNMFIKGQYTSYPYFVPFDFHKNPLNGRACEKLFNKVWLNVGDSITTGINNNYYGYCEMISQSNGIILQQYAKPGASLTDMYNSNDTQVIINQLKASNSAGIKPDFITISGGLNDLIIVEIGEISGDYTTFDTNTIIGAMENTIKYMKETFIGVPIIFVALSRLGTRSAELQKELHYKQMEVCEKWGISVANVYSIFNTFLQIDSDTFTVDKTHPNKLGYERKYCPIVYHEILKLFEY